VVNDRESTPVAHTFTPREAVPGSALFAESNSVPIGEKKFSLRTRRSNGNYYVRAILTVPILVVETINGVDRNIVERVSLIDATFRFAETSTLQERKDAVGMFANALASSQTTVDSVITGLESIW
jgi:hypothetical protein